MAGESGRLALVIGLVVLIVAGLMAFTVFRSAQGGEKGVTLVIVTRLYPEEQKALKSVFLNSSVAKKYGIRDIEFLKEDFAKWPQLAESGRVDGFLIGEKYIYQELCKQGHLAEMSFKPLLELIKDLDRGYYGAGPGGNPCWVVIGQAVYGFIVNRRFLEDNQLPEPDNWASLEAPVYLKPLLRGEETVSFPRPSKSGTARTVVHGLLQKYGWDKGWRLLTIIGVEASIVDSSEKARDDAAEGIVGVAPAYIGYGIEAEKAGKGAVFRIPKGEGILYMSLAAVASKSPHPREMQAFIYWLLSDEGQMSLARLFYYIPVRKVEGIEWVERIYEQMKGNIFSYDRGFAEKVDRAVTTYFEAAIADPDVNGLLRSIGRKVAEKLEKGEMSREEAARLLYSLGAPLTIKDPVTGDRKTFTVDYAESINAKLGDDRVRAEFYNAVKEAALERYRAVLESLGG